MRNEELSVAAEAAFNNDTGGFALLESGMGGAHPSFLIPHS
jgi:hypothetical protein